MPIAKVIKYTQPTKVIERQALDVAYPYRYGRASDSYNITFYGLTDGDRQQLYQLLGSATPISFSTTSGLYTGIPTKVQFKLSAGVQEYYDGEIDLQAGAVWTPLSGINYLSQIPGLAGYWPFDEGSGNYAYDYSGNGNTGTLVNGPTWVPGEFGYALKFNGVNQYVQTSLKPQSVGTPISISGWVIFPNNPSSAQFEFGFRDDTVADFYVVQLQSSNTLEMRFRNSAGTGFQFNPTITPNVWTFVVFTYDGSTLRAYINGQLVASTSASGTFGTSTNSFQIGAWTGVQLPSSATIDDVRIYNRALSPSEIQQIYVNTNKADFPPMFGRSVNINDYSYVNALTNLYENRLAGYWPFEEGSGTTTKDASGNGNTGTLVNGPTWVSGKFGGALSFNGQNQYITTASAYSQFNALTVSGWFRYIANTGSTLVIPFVSFIGGFGLELNRGGQLFVHYCSGNDFGFNVNTNINLLDGNWHFIAFVFPTTTSVFGVIDNSISQTYTIASINTNGSPTIAYDKCDGFTATYPTYMLDDIRIYNRALSASEIQQLYLNNNIFSVNQVSFSGLPIQLTTQEQTQSLVGNVFTLINSDVDVYQPVAPELTTWDLSLNTLSFSDVLFLQQAERSQSLVPFTDGAGITHYVYIKNVDYSEYAGKPSYYAVSVQMVSQS